MNVGGHIGIVPQKQIALADGRLQQVAALVYRGRGADLQVLLITSRGTGRWVLPKGWPQKGKSLARSALSEAHEEAGVRGCLWGQPIGRFCYDKPADRNSPAFAFCVDVFAFRFERQDRHWPEEAVRTLEWVAAGEAARRVVEPELRNLFTRIAEGDLVLP